MKPHTRFATLLLLVAVAMLPLGAQATLPRPNTPTPPLGVKSPAPGTTTLSGSVLDSLSGWPLRGAVVQLVASDEPTKFSRTVMSDSGGFYAVEDIPDGTYTLGFFHPLLDTLELPAIARSITVAGQGFLNANLAVPGPKRMRDVVCGSKAGPTSGGLVMGVVRDARTRKPLSNARVVATWRELQFTGKKMVQRTPHRVATSSENGWYTLCDVPGPGIVSLVATSGTDSTDQVEIDVPASGYLRRELYVGASRTISQTDTIPLSDTLAFRSPTINLGEGRLTGTVVAIQGGNPVVGAVVGITNGPQTRTNDRGVWTLSDVPLGSRTLEVRALGRVPVKRSVDVVEDAPPIRVAMSSFKAVLDTLKVTAGLSSSLDFVEFERRRKTEGMGRFITPADIFRRAPIRTSDLFKNFSGLRVQGPPAAEVIVMRGVFADQCSPAIFLNGSMMLNLDVDMLNAMVRPEGIIGIEVYSPTSMPPQFQSAMSGCGSIVIWARN